MICLAFHRPNDLIANHRHFQATPCVTSKPVFEFNGIQFPHPSSEPTLTLKFQSPRRRRDMADKASIAPPVMLTSGASLRISALLSLTALSNLWRLICSFFLIISLQFRGRRRFMAVGASPEKGGRPSATKGKPVTSPTRKSTAVAVVAARRALAIKRVQEDNYNEETVRDYSLFVTSRGDTIFTQSWTPVKVQIRGLIILLHGLNEHSGRYNDFAKKLNANGFKVYGMDWIGHGGSDGLHGYVPSLDYAVNDLKMFLNKVLSENPSLPCFCFGHSTGGAIILKAVIDPKVQQQIVGVVMSSPAIGVQPTHPIFVILAPVLAFLLPRYQFSAANKEGIIVSRDPAALAAKYSDPLVFTGSIRVRTGYEILRITMYLQQNLSKLRVPFFVLHGTADLVTNPEASKRLYKEASATDKTIKLCEGLLHDLLFEPEKEEIMESIISWLVSRL